MAYAEKGDNEEWLEMDNTETGENVEAYHFSPKAG